MNVLMEQAVSAGWREKNPCKKLSWTPPKSKVDLWEPEHVERMDQACQDDGQPGLGALIVVGYEICQRLGDLRLLRHEHQYQSGVFRLYQSKTDQFVSFPVPPEIAERIEAARVPGSDYLFVNAKTGKPFSEEGVSAIFKRIREGVLKSGEPVLKEGDPDLVLRCLRHSGIVQMARAGATAIQISAISGHLLHRVTQILERYIPTDNPMAWEAVTLRHKKRGGQASDLISLERVKTVWRQPPKEHTMPYRPDVQTPEALARQARLVEAVADL